MNPLLPYEQIIADKLAELPLPNMEEAIWASIEAQLDLDLPSDEGAPPDNGPTAPSGGGMASVIKTAVAVSGIAAIAYILATLPSASDTRLPAPPAAPAATPVPAQQNTVAPATPPVDAPNTAPMTTPAPTADPPPAAADGLTDRVPPLSPPPALDSLAKLSPPPPRDSAGMVPKALPPISVPPSGKKQRGTKGINDSDYRFLTNRDST